MILVCYTARPPLESSSLRARRCMGAVIDSSKQRVISRWPGKLKFHGIICRENRLINNYLCIDCVEVLKNGS